jgi:hypothetical protein
VPPGVSKGGGSGRHDDSAAAGLCGTSWGGRFSRSHAAGQIDMGKLRRMVQHRCVCSGSCSALALYSGTEHLVPYSFSSIPEASWRTCLIEGPL